MYIYFKKSDLQRISRFHSLPKRERVLYMCVSHDGRSIATADTQEKLRFWPIFDEQV